MEILSREDVRSLFEKRNRFCVSLFLPTPREGKEVGVGRIQYKDLLRDTEERLLGAGLTKAGRDELLSAARQLERRSDFWQYQSDGLALFLTHGFFRHYRLPLKLSAFAVVADRFEITPLLPLWASEDRFYLLALSRKQVRVFEGTRYATSELYIDALPRGLPEILETSIDSSERQQHTLKAGLPEDELLYFRQIDEILRRSLRDQQVPLVLAAVEKAISAYRQVNQYATLLADGLPGNPDRLSAEELHAKAVKIVKDYYDQARKIALLQYKERSDATKTSDKLTEILPAAHQGRIFHLFVATGKEKWGKFDPEQEAVTLHDQAEKGDQELINLAVVETILHGGTVYALDPAEVPNGALTAAVFRY